MGFKKTSETIAISFSLQELGPNTFIQDEIALQLDVLNNEIFVVVAADLNVSAPDALAGIDTNVRASITTTSQTTLQTIGQTNTIAESSDNIQAAGFVDGGVGFSRSASETYTGDVEYISLIATNNFFCQLQGTGNAGTKSAAGRLWGYRARADSATYAALVQSEVLSA